MNSPTTNEQVKHIVRFLFCFNLRITVSSMPITFPLLPLIIGENHFPTQRRLSGLVDVLFHTGCRYIARPGWQADITCFTITEL